ncbi:MAG TPA: phosphoenolpyruvate--protein phosphotransferase [Thermoanaerobaculia bacterium]|nr:phosphoenolpyruvate--protein phosphotransferase [Thermoanaerobaculia bacterium]
MAVDPSSGRQEPLAMQFLQGLGVSEGIAIGRAVCLETRLEEVYRFPLPPEEIEEELERFRRAIGQARSDVESLGERVGLELGDDLAGIFEAHSMLLGDQHLLDRIEGRIRDEAVNAEWAVWETANELRERFASLQSERFRDRGEDLQDVGRHLIRALQGVSHHELSEIAGDVVVIADDLTPSDAVRLGRQGVVGFAIEAGGRTSHTAIIAHSLNIPLVTGLPGITRLAAYDDLVVVDGTSGKVVLHPTDHVIKEHLQKQQFAQALEEELAATRDLPAVTRDGLSVDLAANIDLSEEIEDAVRYGATGIGLYRSEFLYIERSPAMPSEEEHYALYRQLLEAMAPHPVVIRTYDLGGRKLAREVMETHEDNPVLGLRGIRLTLARPQVFRTQLRALFRAGYHGDLWVLLPMVGTLDEVRQFRLFADSVRDELEGEGITFAATYKLGVMIEVPSAALIADHLAGEVDFFSIGTNDLIQYALAVDRNNEHVTHLYQPLHPAILRMVDFVVTQAAKAGIPVSVCGEMAADPLAAMVLLGLGVERLSMSPRRVPAIKARIRSLAIEELRKDARRCLDLGSAAEVVEYLASRRVGAGR